MADKFGLSLGHGEKIPDVTRVAHTVLFGGSRRGKSGGLELIIRSDMRRGFYGGTLVDMPGELARAIYKYTANPRHGLTDRKIHYLNPSSLTVSFGFNPLQPAEKTEKGYHDVAVSVMSSFAHAWGNDSAATPRLSKLIYSTSLILARAGLTLAETPMLLRMGSSAVRDALLESYDGSNDFFMQSLRDLYDLPPKQFKEYVESCESRFIRLLGDPGIRRALGQKKGLNPREVMDNREWVFVDLGGLHSEDARLFASLLNTRYFDDAKRRPPRQCAQHMLYLDEAESQLTDVVAQGLDQTAKFGLSYVLAIQRIEQARKSAFLFDAIMTNTACKIVFGGLEIDSAEYLARTFMSGYFDLSEWKKGTERPVVVGYKRAVMQNWSNGVNRTTTESNTITNSVSETQQKSMTLTEGISDSHQESNGVSHGIGIGTDGANAYWGNMLGFTPLGSMFNLGDNVVESRGDSNSIADTHSRSTSVAYGDGLAQTVGQSNAASRGESVGTTRTDGGAETLQAKLQWLPSTTYTLQEQVSRFAGELHNLPRRCAYVKIEGQRPFRERTRDLEPAFHSKELEDVCVPLHDADVLAHSGIMIPPDEGDRLVQERWLALERDAALIEEEQAVPNKPSRGRLAKLR